jgi:uncharacterized membrane protein
MRSGVAIPRVDRLSGFDATISSGQIRRAVLLRAVLSFAYNTAILAFALSPVFGLAG